MNNVNVHVFSSQPCLITGGYSLKNPLKPPFPYGFSYGFLSLWRGADRGWEGQCEVTMQKQQGVYENALDLQWLDERFEAEVLTMVYETTRPINCWENGF